MKRKAKIIARANRVVKKLDPRLLASHRRTKQTISELAERLGLVYFGYVNQNDDDHKLIRGITTSTSHTDSHYCIGTYKNYDLSLTLRTDTISKANERPVEHYWLIVQIDLKHYQDMPHVYVAHSKSLDLFRSKYTRLMPVSLDVFGAHDQKFTNQFTVYANPSDFLSLERLLPPQVTNVISSHFGEASIELEGDIIYISQPTQHPSRALLEMTLSNVLWLAETLDAQAIYARTVLQSRQQ